MSLLSAAVRRRTSRDGPGGSAAGLTLAAAVLGFFMVTLDAVVVNVALPTIRHDLGGGITSLQWIVDGYTLMFAALLSLYLQELRGLSALATGTAFPPMMLTGAALTPLSARIAERTGAQVLSSGSLILMTAGLVILAVIRPRPSGRWRC